MELNLAKIKVKKNLQLNKKYDIIVNGLCRIALFLRDFIIFLTQKIKAKCCRNKAISERRFIL